MTENRKENVRTKQTNEKHENRCRSGFSFVLRVLNSISFGDCLPHNTTHYFYFDTSNRKRLCSIFDWRYECTRSHLCVKRKWSKTTYFSEVHARVHTELSNWTQMERREGEGEKEKSPENTKHTKIHKRDTNNRNDTALRWNHMRVIPLFCWTSKQNNVQSEYRSRTNEIMHG